LAAPFLAGGLAAPFFFGGMVMVLMRPTDSVELLSFHQVFRFCSVFAREAARRALDG
jgi:hypothetical protein